MKDFGRRLDRRRLLVVAGTALLALAGLAACDIGQDQDENKKSGEVGSRQQRAARARAAD